MPPLPRRVGFLHRPNVLSPLRPRGGFVLFVRYKKNKKGSSLRFFGVRCCPLTELPDFYANSERSLPTPHSLPKKPTDKFFSQNIPNQSGSNIRRFAAEKADGQILPQNIPNQSGCNICRYATKKAPTLWGWGFSYNVKSY